MDSRLKGVFPFLSWALKAVTVEVRLGNYWKEKITGSYVSSVHSVLVCQHSGCSLLQVVTQGPEITSRVTFQADGRKHKH